MLAGSTLLPPDSGVRGSDSDSEGDQYGQPSDDETGSSQRTRPQGALAEDDRPLGCSDADLHAQHRRIIREEQSAQIDKTLLKLEGRAAPPEPSSLRRSATARPARTAQHMEDRERRDRALARSATRHRGNTVRHRPGDVQRAAVGYGSPGTPAVQGGTPGVMPHGTGVADSPPLLLSRGKSLNKQAGASGRRMPVDAGAAETSRSARVASMRAAHARNASGDLQGARRRLLYGDDSVGALTHDMHHFDPYSGDADPAPLTSHRVFIISQQRYVMLQLPEDTPALTMTHAAVAKASLGPCPDSQDAWAVFDVRPELEIERPLRDYERVQEVVGTHGGTDYLLVKNTSFAGLLHARAVPPASPVICGWVSVYEGRKSHRRWLELREHRVFSARSEKGKDEVCLCAMLDADVFLVDAARTRALKTRAFVLRAGDTTPVLVAPPDEAAFRDWMRALTGARSYVLRQERPELFRHPALYARPQHGAVNPEFPGYTRGGQRTTSGRHVPAAAPLIQQSSLNPQFEQGSLLASLSDAPRPA